MKKLFAEPFTWFGIAAVLLVLRFILFFEPSLTSHCTKTTQNFDMDSTVSVMECKWWKRDSSWPDSIHIIRWKVR